MPLLTASQVALYQSYRTAAEASRAALRARIQAARAALQGVSR